MSATELDDFEARIEALKLRWEALSGPEKGAIRARFDRLNPMPEGSHPRFWELTRRHACLDLMEGDGPVIAVPAARPPDPGTAPIRDPSPGPARPTGKQRQEFLDGLAPDDRARFEACSPARQDDLIKAALAGVIGGERIVRNPARFPDPIREPEPEPAWSLS